MRREILAVIGVLSLVLVAIMAFYGLSFDDSAHAPSGGADVTAHLNLSFANGSNVRFDDLILTAGNTSVLDLLSAAAKAGNFSIQTTY